MTSLLNAFKLFNKLTNKRHKPSVNDIAPDNYYRILVKENHIKTMQEPTR